MPLQNRNQTTAKERALARAKANTLAEQREQQENLGKAAAMAAAKGGTAKERALARAKANTIAEQQAAEKQQVGTKTSLPAAASGGKSATKGAAKKKTVDLRKELLTSTNAQSKAVESGKTKKQTASLDWKKLLASTNAQSKAVESGKAKKQTTPFETRTRGLTMARAGDADAMATREMKLGNTEKVEKSNPYANALSAALEGVGSGLTNALSMAQQGAARIEEAYAPYAGTSHAREEMGYQTTKEEAAKKNKAAYELTQKKADQLSESAAKHTEAAKEGQGTIGKLLVDLGVQGVQMGTDIALGAATGGGALVPMAARVFGQGAQEARQAGASYGQQLAYGAASAAIETVTEKLFDGLAGAYGKSWLGKTQTAKSISEALNRKLASRPAGRAALKLLGSMAGEGAEEVISGIVNPIAQTIYNDQGIKESYRENFDWSETLYEGLVGALMGGLGGAVEVPGNYRDGKVRAAANAIDSYYDAIEKKGLFSREAQQKAAKAEKTIEKLTGEKPTVGRKKNAEEPEEPRYLKTAEEMAAEPTLEELMAGGRATQEQQEAFIRKYGEEAFNRLVVENMQNGRIDGEGNDLVWKTEEPRYLKRAEEPAQQNTQQLQAEEPRYLRTAEGQTAQELQEPRYLKTAEEMTLEEPGVHGDTAWMSREDADYLSQLAKAARASIEVVDTLGDAQGTYDPKTGRIRIAKDATDPVGFVTQHELTHRIRDNAPQQWGQFLDYVQKHYGEDWSGVLEGYQRRYAEHGIELTAEEAAEEAVADFAGRMNESDIRRLTQENRSLAQRILDAIRDLIRRLKGGENQKLYEMEKLWASALKEGNKNTATEGGVRYSVGETDDGRPVAVVDSDILSGIDTSKWDKAKKERAKAAAKEALLAFRDGVRVNGTTYKVNKKSRDEYTRSNDSEQLFREKTPVFADKMRAAANADDIITATTSWARDGKLEHPRTDNLVDFYHGDVLIQAGENQYKAETVVGITNSGKYVFYDVVDMEPTKFKVKEELSTAAAGKNTVSAIQESSSDESVRYPNAKSNPQNAEKTKKSLKSYTEEEKKQHVKDARAHFGRTYKWAETGYITPDGGRLDFSGRHEGGPGGYRTVDHRDIRDALGDDYGGDDYSGSMVQFMSEGNIRVSPESGGIDLSVKPTKAQEEALSDFISKQRGEVILDLDTPEGQTVSSTEYPRGTHASKVIADIRAYFEDGTAPQVSEVAKYRQSLKGSKDAAEEIERLREQNKRLEKEIAALKDAVRLETRSSTDWKGTEKAAREMRKRFGSKVDQTELTEALLDLYDGMAAGTLSNQEMRDLARRAADTVIDGAERNVNPLYEEYADLRKELRTEKVTLPEENRADIQDGYNTLRKRAMGSVKIGNDGIPVDVRYEALSEQYPELFPDDILNPADQLERMVDVGERLKRTMGNPYKGLEGEGIRQGLANDIMEQFFDISTTQGARLQKMQREWEKQRARDRKATDERFRKSRERQEERIKELKQDYVEANRRRQENATATVLRDSIGREALRLGKKLTRPTDKNHVPEEFRGAVAELVRLIDTESGYDIETTRGGKFIRVKKGEGDPTKKTDAARALKAEIEELQKTEGLTVDPELQDRLNEIAAMKDIPLAEMNKSQLETVWKVVRSVSKMITESNRMFGESRYATVSAAAEKLLRDNGSRKDKAQRRGSLGTAQQLAGLEMMTPETYFHELGQAGEETFRQFRRAADDQTRIIKEATDLAARAVKDSGLNVKKLEKETKTFHLESGEEITLTKAQLMELYELTKRKQAQEHIFLGGVKSVGYETKAKAGHKVVTPSKASKVTLNDVSEMLKTLTPAEKQLADTLQRYMSGGLARHGNRASYDVYGYNKFTEKDYWPIKVNKGEVQSDVGAEAKSKTIPSFGMTRAVTPKASNGLMLNSFLDTYTEHVNQMATYAAWLGASENASRLYNYRFRDGEGNATGDTVKNLLQKVYGRGGTQYFEKLMSDIAQGTKTGADQAPTDKLFSSYKAAAVGANLRVIMQQPTAILRAAEMINPKYLAKNFGRKGGWNKAVKHAPIAQWKEWGYFELDTGRSLRQLILGQESWGDKVREASMAPAGWGDSIAWGLLWNAVEDETADRRPELRRGSQEFYDAAADRFTDIIYRTQVVDNVLNRSQAVRKNGAWRLATSFMSEPSKVYNMMQRDVMDLRRAMGAKNRAATEKAAGHMARTSAALVASFAVNAVAQAVADSMRDDDREETPLEKFGGKWLENFAGNFNPLGYVPFAKDVMSIIQGYDVERMDMSAFSDAWAAMQTAYKAWTGTGSKSALAGTLDAAAQMCKVAGLPVYNVKRDLQALIGSSLLQAGQWQALYELDKLLLNPEKSKGRFYDTLYYAMLNDWDAYEKIYADMLKHGFDEDGISGGMEDRMRAAEEVKYVKQLPIRWAPPGTADSRALKNYIARNRED